MSPYSGTFLAINPTNDRIHVRVCAHSNSSNEEWAIDLIQVSDIGPLPVELVGFSGKMEENYVNLDWRTESELNNTSF
ncbi:MAG: hypothetical protein AAF705_20555, partial [Bacteroidota bacterium]